MSEQQLKITKIARFSTKKDGSPLLTKKGNPYTSVRFTAAEYGERWISGFGNKDNTGWKEGDTITAVIEEKGEYLNFSMPKADSFAGSPAQIINILNFKVIPMLTEIHTLLQVAAKPESEDDFKMPDFGENEPEEQ